MYFSLSELSFWSYFIFFFLTSFFSWVIPGWLVSSRLYLRDKLSETLLAVPIGIALWGIQGYVFGYAQIRWMTYVYLFVTTMLFFRQQINFRQRFKEAGNTLFAQPWWITFTVLASSVLQIFGHLLSGLKVESGMAFYSVRSSIMHLSYIQAISERFPPHEPGAVNLPLENYHYWSDLVLADMFRVWHLPIVHMFFHYVPVLLSLTFTLLICRLVYGLRGSHFTVLIVIFLFTVGADASYIFSLLLNGNWGAHIATIDSGLVQYFNIPQVFARLIFVAVIFLFLNWWQSKNYFSAVVGVVLTATLFGFKVYYGMYAVLGFCIVLLTQFLVRLANTLRVKSAGEAITSTVVGVHKEIGLFVLLFVLCLTVYLPPNKAAGGLFYAPLEWPKIFLSAGQLDYSDWWLRMQVYREAGNYRNIFIFNTLAVGITLMSVYGTRLLGVLPSWRSLQSLPKELLLFFVPANLIFLILALFTLQESGGLNVFNFFIVPVVSFNLLAGFNISTLRGRLPLLIFLLLIPLTLPRSVLKIREIINSFQAGNATISVSSDELNALRFAAVRLPAEAVLQSHPSNGQDLQAPYVSFFSGRDSYVSGVSILESHNQPYQARQEKLQTAFDQSNPFPALVELGIDYIYVTSNLESELNIKSDQVIYRNGSVSIVSTGSQ